MLHGHQIMESFPTSPCPYNELLLFPQRSHLPTDLTMHLGDADIISWEGCHEFSSKEELNSPGGTEEAAAT